MNPIDSYSKYIEYPEFEEYIKGHINDEWIGKVNEIKTRLLRGKEIAEQINILGDDGVPVEYHGENDTESKGRRLWSGDQGRDMARASGTGIRIGYLWDKARAVRAASTGEPSALEPRGGRYGGSKEVSGMAREPNMIDDTFSITS